MLDEHVEHDGLERHVVLQVEVDHDGLPGEVTVADIVAVERKIDLRLLKNFVTAPRDLLNDWVLLDVNYGMLHLKRRIVLILAALALRLAVVTAKFSDFIRLWLVYLTDNANATPQIIVSVHQKRHDCV